MAYSPGHARFWLSYTGSRGSSQGHGISAGDGVHVRGWDAGVRVTPRNRARDEFDVYLTGGSHDEGRSVHLGTVHDTPDGPRWAPEAKPDTVIVHVADQDALTRLKIALMGVPGAEIR